VSIIIKISLTAFPALKAPVHRYSILPRPGCWNGSIEQVYHMTDPKSVPSSFSMRPARRQVRCGTLGRKSLEGAEGGGEYHEEVAGHYDLGTVADKGEPTLFRVRRAHRTVPADSAWGGLNSQLQLQLVGDPFLSRSRILCGFCGGSNISASKHPSSTPKPSSDTASLIASKFRGSIGGSGSFALGHPGKLVDFSWRSEHEMTVKAKAIVEAFYGSAPRRSYWNGCSTGGRQGLNEAQMFPDDYDGIVAGAPAKRSLLGLWNGFAMFRDAGSFVPPGKYPAIHQAVLEACDALDGLKDGLIVPAPLVLRPDRADSVQPSWQRHLRSINGRNGAGSSPGFRSYTSTPLAPHGWSRRW
jgi:hypothetical protein